MSQKIMTTILLTPFMALALIVCVILIYAPLSFADYINRMTLSELNEVVVELAKEYRNQRGWETLKKDPLRWQRILKSTQPTPFFLELASIPAPAYGKSSQGTPHSGSPRHLDRWVRELALFDADKRLVAGGMPEAQATNYTIRVIRLDDQIVGWLGLYKRDHLSDPFIVSFLNEQSTMLYIIGGSILLLTATLSFLLSSHLLAPIRQLDEGMRALTIFRVRTQNELSLLASNSNRVNGAFDQYNTLRKSRISNGFNKLHISLAMLRGKIEALRDDDGGHNGATLGSLRAERIRLGRQSDDLHRLSLFASQSLMIRKASIKPVQVLRDTVVGYEALLTKKGISLKLDICAAWQFMLPANADQMTQLFSNLLENTLRHTDSPGTLKIGATATIQQVTIVFENSAPRIPVAAMKQLFEQSNQTDTADSWDFCGIESGLLTCKEIVRAHSGTIQAANSPLGGLIIIINLPLAAGDKHLPIGA